MTSDNLRYRTYLLGEISKLGHSESPAVTLGVVLLNLGQVILEVAEPDLLLLQAGVFLPMERLEPCELLHWVQTDCQAAR